MSQPPADRPVDAPLEVEVEAFARLRQQAPPPTVVDVREPWEAEICGFPEAELIPLGTLARRLEDIPRDRPVIVVCHAGRRSLRAVEFLRTHGIADSSSLKGGVEAWALRIDSSMARY